MIKVKYNIDAESLKENVDYDLDAFKSITVSFDTFGRLSIVGVNQQLVVDNTILIVDEKQKVDNDVSRF